MHFAIAAKLSAQPPSSFLTLRNEERRKYTRARDASARETGEASARASERDGAREGARRREARARARDGGGYARGGGGASQVDGARCDLLARG